jgi:hypothetical protein
MDLNEKYRLIKVDNYYTLQFHEMREKQFLNPASRKYEGTGEMKEFKESLYFTTLEAALKYFLYTCAEGCSTVDEILSAVKEGVKTMSTAINQQSIKL